jgi:O-antigen/teichoic acid export membrane protein
MEAAMAGIRIFDLHRTWEDWIGILLGLLIVLSPWFAGQDDNQTVTLNAGLIGVLVLALAAVELVDLHRWEETGEIACGLWLIASPYIFGYAGTGVLQYWHFGLGAVVVLLAAMELWQDWTLNDKQLAEHGVE